MNRRLLLLLPKTDSVGYGVVGYAGVDLAVDNDITAMKVWNWGDGPFDVPTPLVKRGDTVTFKRPLPFNLGAAVADERNRGLSMSEIVDRAMLHLDAEERKSRSELMFDILRVGIMKGNPFLMFTPPVQHNKLLLKRKQT